MNGIFADRPRALQVRRRIATGAATRNPPLTWRAAIAVIGLMSGGLWALIWLAARFFLSLPG